MIDTTVNLPTLITVALAAIGFVAWLVRMEGRVNNNKTDIEQFEKRLGEMSAASAKTDRELSDYKTHVAETFVTKQGMAEQTDRLMKAIADVAVRLDGIGSRIDRLYEAKPTRRGSTT